jgi:uncharacterized LabA/DUF88 family protein
MAGRAIRSALLIDIENVSYARLSTSIPNWLAWLEHGQFDPAKQRRKFVLKRAYWNSTSEHDRKKFESRGIDAILVDRYVTLKNTADVHMAIDIIELLYTRPDIEEFVLLSKDSDFIPVMQRLRLKHKKTAVLVDLASPTLHTAFRDKVDIVIPHRDLLLATTYNPPLPKLGLIGRWRAKMATKREQARITREARNTTVPAPADIGTTSNNAGDAKSTSAVAPPAPPIKLPDGTPLQQAASLTSALLKQSRGFYVPQRAILTHLKAIPAFTELGNTRFLTLGSYHALMLHLAADDPLIRIDQQSSGHTAVRYLSQREQQQRLKAASERPGTPTNPVQTRPQTRPKTRGAKGIVGAAFPPPLTLTLEQTKLLDQAIIAISVIAEQRPGAFLSRQALLDAICSVPGIQNELPDKLLGSGSLSGFMFEVARRDPAFLISEETGGGKGYRYIPSDKTKGVTTQGPASDAASDAPTPVPSLPLQLMPAANGPPSTALPLTPPPIRVPHSEPTPAMPITEQQSPSSQPPLS